MTTTPEWLSPLASALRDVLALLRDSGIRNVVIGGVAASTMGKPRLTHDIDLTAELENDAIGTFFERARNYGFLPRLAEPEAFARRSRMILLVHEASQTDIDIAMAGLPFESEAIDRAWHVKLAGIDVAVASPEDLVIMKAVAGRPTDVEDIKFVLDSHPELDFVRVRAYLRQFAEVLDAPDVVTRFAEVVTRWERDRAQDQPLTGR
jgi:predicted nucleotidyltransferase